LSIPSLILSFVVCRFVTIGADLGEDRDFPPGNQPKCSGGAMHNKRWSMQKGEMVRKKLQPAALEVKI